MKKVNVLSVYQTIAGLLNNEEIKSGSIKLRHALIRNAAFLESEIKLQEKERADILEGNKDYEKERVELVKKYGKEQPGGGWKVEDDSPEMKKFMKEIEKLREKHREAVDKYESEMKEYNESLSIEEADVRIYQIDVNLLPQNIENEQLAVLEINGLIAD